MSVFFKYIFTLMKITVEKANHDNSQKTALFLEDLKQERCIF